MLAMCQEHNFSSATLQVYLPMSYLYGIRARCQETELICDLRHELYPMPYDTISWDAARNCCAKVMLLAIKFYKTCAQVPFTLSAAGLFLVQHDQEVPNLQLCLMVACNPASQAHL